MKSFINMIVLIHMKKEIRPLTQGIAFADLSQYLYEHLPGNIEMRIRIANPANLEAFFGELKNKWLESGGNLFRDSQTLYQQPSVPQIQQQPIYQSNIPQMQSKPYIKKQHAFSERHYV